MTGTEIRFVAAALSTILGGAMAVAGIYHREPLIIAVGTGLAISWPNHWAVDYLNERSEVAYLQSLKSDKTNEK